MLLSDLPMLFDDEEKELKNELQGDGFLKEVKEKRLPDSEELSKRALKELEGHYANLSPGKVREDADAILQRLLKLEHEIYDREEAKVYKQALVMFLDEKYDTGQTSIHSFAESDEEPDTYTEYEQLQRLFKEVEDIYASGEDFKDSFSKILPLLYPAMDAISVSAAQSRRKRAGTSLQNHLENLLIKAEFVINDSEVAGNGVVYHLSQDSTATFPEEEGTPVYISSLMTMRDRFRQSLSESPGGFDTRELPKYIATASGNSLAKTSGQSDVTSEKVKEIQNEGFTLVAFEDVVHEFFPDQEGVISYSEFLSQELPQKLKAG